MVFFVVFVFGFVFQKSLRKNISLHYLRFFVTADTGTRADTLQMGKGKMLDVESHTEIGLIFMNTGYQTHGFKDF